MVGSTSLPRNPVLKRNCLINFGCIFIYFEIIQYIYIFFFDILKQNRHNVLYYYCIIYCNKMKYVDPLLKKKQYCTGTKIFTFTLEQQEYYVKK